MNPIKLQEIANSNNIEGDVKELAGNKTIVDIVYKDLVKCANVGKLGKAQTPTAVHLETEPWLPETGLVTDALKIKRKVIFDTLHPISSLQFMAPSNNSLALNERNF